MLTNVMHSRIYIQKKAVTQSATGSTVTWRPIETRFGEVIPLDVRARIAYQQIKSEATHRILFRDNVGLNLSKYRLAHGSKTYQPVEPQQFNGTYTEIAVKEI